VRPAPADALILDHLDWCRAISRNIARRLGAPDWDDIVADGYVGLVIAARSFDSSLGVPFTAWAQRRISGEIIDRQRQADPLTRTDRRLWAQRQAAVDRVSRRTLHEPTHAELAGEMRIGETELALLGERVRGARYPARIDEAPVSEDGEIRPLQQGLEDRAAGDAFEEVEIGMLRDQLAERDRLVLRMADDGYRLREIGDVLHVSQSRACQLRSRAHRRLAAMAA
jgi:RNA polymerase sigma factor for flagellar operon FliA